jgi:hypothetical protein
LDDYDALVKVLLSDEFVYHWVFCDDLIRDELDLELLSDGYGLTRGDDALARK